MGFVASSMFAICVCISGMFNSVIRRRDGVLRGEMLDYWDAC